MMKRINITIDENLLNRIDSYTRKRYFSRSGLIAFALSTYLDTVEEDPKNLKQINGFVEV